jgi:alkylation response protein AidB-like acyl-CoA dehydrogenase
VELTSEQRALRESVRDVLRRNPPDAPGMLPGDPASKRLWRLLCEVGVAGLAVPERFGGAGAGPVELAIVAEQLGRELAPVPLLGSAVLTTQAIVASGDTEACERLLPAMTEGAVGALAWTGHGGGWDPLQAALRAEHRAGGGWTLTGSAHYVLDGDHADVLVAAATLAGGGIGLFEVDPAQPGVDRQCATSMDQTRRLATVRLAAAAERPLGPAGSAALAGSAESAGPRPADPRGASAALARARDLACIALSAEQAGAAARAVELTVSYTSARIQFGRAIASFQAIQHRLAEMHVLVESARALAYRAARVAAAASPASGETSPAGWPDPQVPLLAAAARAYCSQAFATVAAEMIQLHGAIGVTWEHDAHRYFKRAHASAQLFGPPSSYLAQIARAVIDA